DPYRGGDRGHLRRERDRILAPRRGPRAVAQDRPFAGAVPVSSGRDGTDPVKTGRTLQPEDEISHYRVVGPLGAGGMGEVYLARDQSLERSVALKVLPPELVRSAERVRRFQREAKSASS